MSYRRARLAPRTIDEAIEIAAPLIGDIRLREEEHEAIALLVAEFRQKATADRIAS